jgi:hypothetical protein
VKLFGRICAHAAALLSAGACRTAQARPDVPAVITEPTSQTRAELVQAVSAALGGSTVTLADDALTRDDKLVVERKRQLDPNGLRVNGRDLGRPETFRLMKNGTDCVLVHENSGRRFPLAQTACAAI